MANTLTKAALAPIAGPLGGEEALNRLAYPVIREIMTFPGDVVAVTKTFYEIRLRSPKGGYDVYDRYHQYLYSVAYDPTQSAVYTDNGMESTLNEMVFGRDPQDVIFMSGAPLGSLFYLGYTQVRNGREVRRLVCVVISPLTQLQLQQAQPTHGSQLRSL